MTHIAVMVYTLEGMTLRSIVSVLGIAAFGAATLLGAGTAQASEPQPSGRPDSDIVIPYGDNFDGWQVKIHNESDISLPTFESGVLSNVKSASPELAAHGTADVHGVRSLFGGPANMNFTYWSSSSDGIRVHITSDSLGGTRIYCGGASLTQPSKLECDVTQTSTDRPIEIMVRHK